MKRPVFPVRLIWVMLLGIMFIALLCLSACDKQGPPSLTREETVSVSADGGPTGSDPSEEKSSAETSLAFEPLETGRESGDPSSGDTTEGTGDHETEGASTNGEGDPTTSAGGEILTLPPETVPEPETGEAVMPRLDIRTDNGRDITSKTEYTHGTATLSQCPEKYAFENVGLNIRARGNSTFVAPKKPFRLKFDEKQEMLGLNGGRAYKSWVLMADYYDASMLRTLGTFRFAKVLLENRYYSSDCTHVEVYLNGEYWGVYLLCEQTQINRGRVNIPEMQEGDTSVEQGYLMIGVGGQMDEPELITVKPNITVRDRNGKTRYYGGINFALSGGTYTQAQKDYVAKYVSGVFQVVAKAVYEQEYYTLHRDGRLTPKRSFSWAETEEEKQIETVSAVFDLRSAVSMCILDEICKNLDAMAFNMYVDLSPEGDGVLTLAAPWDFDFSIANTHYATTHSFTGFYATNLSVSEGERVNVWHVMLGSIPWFEDMVREQWQESYIRLQGVVSELISENYAYNAAFDRDWERWGRASARNLIHHHDTTDLATFDRHMAAGEFVTNWLTKRLWWLNRQWGDGESQAFPVAPDAPELRLSFEEQEDMALITDVKRCTVELTAKNGLLLRPTAEARDPYFSFDYGRLSKEYEAMLYPVLEFTYMIPRSSSRKSFVTELFLCTGETVGPTGGISAQVEVTADGEWHTVRLDLLDTGFWMGRIHAIRMDFFSECGAGDRMYLKDFKLLSE